MRNELALLRNMWPAVFLGTALVAGQDTPEAASVQGSSADLPEAMTHALERGQLALVVHGVWTSG